MKISTWNIILLFLFSLVSVGLLTPLMRSVAIQMNIVDNPTAPHKTHQTPIPYLGGTAISIGVTSVTLFALMAKKAEFSEFILAISILVPAVILSIVGLVDDILSLSPWPRFLAQNVIGFCSALILVRTQTIGEPTGITIFDFVISIFWIVGLCNAVNFFDNVDGGASGSIAISAMAISAYAFQTDQIYIAAQAIVLSGATIGFLLWNKPPARIYMGDSGSLFLGLVVASLTIRIEPTPINHFSSLATPFLLLAMPIMDTTVAVLSRIRRRVSPFRGGRDHLSHRLIRLGLEKKVAIYILWLLTFFFSFTSFLISILPFHLEGLITLLVILIWTLVLIFFLTTSDV